MDHARLDTARKIDAWFLSQSRLSSIRGVLGSSCSAISATAVASTCGASGIPQATLLPAFHPPPIHARSTSISMPVLILLSAISERLQALNCLSAITENAVGITQLVVSGI